MPACVSPRPGRQQHGLKTPACPAQFGWAAVAPGRMDRAASNSIPPASDKYAPPLAPAGEADPLAAGWRLATPPAFDRGGCLSRERQTNGRLFWVSGIWRVRGWKKNTSPDAMRGISCARHRGRPWLPRRYPDVYAARSRALHQTSVR